MTITDDLALALELAGVGTRAVDIFAGGLALPDLVDEDPEGGIVQIGDPYGGDLPTRVMSEGPSAPALLRPRVQLLARGATYTRARDKADQALAALDWAGPMILNGTSYVHIEALQRPAFFLELDAKGRTVFAANLAVTVEGG